uniref:Latrophilin Cirl n=1 Tax=Culicoides sonorensis TaxID=179676 RepID=A0A336LM03_CULSO
MYSIWKAMHNHQCPYCLRGTVPIDKKCNTPASSKATDTTTTTICRCQNRHTLLVNPELDHNQQNYRNNTISKSGCNILQQIQKIPSSNELLKKMYLQQSSKYFDGCCHNLAIYPVNSNSCDPLQIHCCRQEKRNCSNICWQHQYQNDSRINQLPSLSAVSSHHNTHPSNNNNNQINCNGCQYSDISFSPATTITNATYFSSPVYKSDCSKNNKNNCKCTKIACTIASEFYQSNNKIDENSLASSCKFDQYDVYSNSHHYFKGYPTTDDDKQFTIIKNSDLSALTKNSNYNKNKQIEDEEKIIIVENNKKMSSGKSDIKINNNNNNRNRSFKKSKKNELWTEFTKLLLGKGNGSRLHNNCKRNLRIESFTKSTIISIFTSIFLLIALLPSFTLAASVNYPYGHKSVGEVIFETMTKDLNHVCQISDDSGQIYTNERALKAAISFVNALKIKGIQQGDKIIVLMHNHHYLLPTWLGCALAGFILCPFHFTNTSVKAELVDLVDQIRPKIMITSYLDAVDTFQSIFKQINLECEVYIYQNKQSNCFDLKPLLEKYFTNFDEFQPIKTADPENELFVVVLSSSTTGKPKLINGTHAQLLHQTIGPFSRIVVSSTMLPGWNSELVLLFIVLIKFCTRIIRAHYTIDEFLLMLQKHKVQTIYIKPKDIFQMIKCETIHRVSLKHLRRVASTGEHMSIKMALELKKHIPNCTVLSCYGITDIGGALTTPSDSKKLVHQLVGKVRRGFDFIVVDTKMNRLGPNQIGELCVKSNLCKFPGYFNNDKLTRETLTTDGFFITGDLGKLLNQGEVERIILENVQGISAVCVVDVENDEHGMIPYIAIIPDTDAVLSESDVVKTVMKHHSFEFETRVFFFDSLPMTISSKFKKHLIRQMIIKKIYDEIFLISRLNHIFLILRDMATVPKVGTAYACEDKTLTIECEPGDTINIIRANFGRFSLTICNDHGNVDWSVNCMSQKSLRVLNTKCATKQNCSVSASASLFGDPCPGTRKYLEANYRCESAIHTTTVINRLSPPPWQVTSQPSVWSTSTIRTPTTSRTVGNQNSQHGKESPFEEIFNGFRVTTQRFNLLGSTTTGDKTISTTTQRVVSSTEESFHASKNDEKKLLGGGRHTIGGLSFDDTKAVSDDRNLNRFGIMPSMAPTVQEEHSTPFSVLLNTKTGDNSKNYDPSLENLFCAPTMARNLFWNVTRAGDVNVQPCPGGATGIAKWRCVLARNATYSDGILHNGFPHTFVSLDSQSDSSNVSVNNTNAKAIWYPSTPDLTQCRSLWLNSLEIRVNQRDSSLISIANDLSQVTSSKTLYGGDMLVTTKIIQTMSEKMTYDIETFPDQRQRETTVTELLHGVVKTGSNLLDSSQEPSWHDLSFEDQMRVATSLLTGLEDNAFLLADTINRERNVVQKVFPDSDSEQWEVSDDQIEIPKGALIENNEGGLVRIVFVAFDRLESILKPATIWMDSKLTSNTDSSLQNNGSDKQGIEPRKRILNSKVISASLGKGRHIQLSQPIRLVLKHLIMENVTNPSCVFWNYIDHAWSDDGCYVETTNRTHTTCMCNHLTNFAILMDVVDDMPTSLLSILDDNLRVLIYISISISIILIIVAIITLKMFNGLLIKSCRTTIYRNLYICLLFIEILFLVGIELTEDHVLCGFASAFLHCSFLSATGWIFFEGYQLYLTLTNDDMMLEVEKSSRILWYYLFTYGLAFLIVTISIAIDPFVYTRADYCVWMEQTNVFWSTFITPIIIFILINLVYSAMAINVMNKKFTNSLKTKEHTRLASASSRAENVTMNKIRVVIFYLRCSFIFMTTFIFNWLFAFLYIKNQKWKALGMEYAGEGLTSTYGYLFIFFNTFQGIRREYCKFAQRQSWLPNCLRCAQQPSGVPSTSSNNVQHQIGGENSLSGINNFPVGTCLPSGVPGGQLIPTGATMEGGGTLSRHPQMGTKGKRLVYGIDGMPETGTLRGQIMPMGSQTSPMSSTGSTQLIYNGTTNARHLQEWAYQHPESQINKNAFDERLLYYDTNAKNLKQSRSRDNELHDDDSLGQSHEQQHDELK